MKFLEHQRTATQASHPTQIFIKLSCNCTSITFVTLLDFAFMANETQKVKCQRV